MSYEAQISRSNPTCLLFLIDQSKSMEDTTEVDGIKIRKADGVAEAINRLLHNLVIRCTRNEGIRDYFHVGVLGYGATVGPAFVGPLSGKDIVPISEIGTHPARLDEKTKKTDDGSGGIVERKTKIPIWFDAVADGATPMCPALASARTILEAWHLQHPDCFPPAVIHITDGEATDSDGNHMAPDKVLAAMDGIKNLKSSDGNVLLFNLHLSSNPQAKKISFPNSPAHLPDPFARTLFEGSSTLTAAMIAVAKGYGFQLGDGARGFVMNSDMTLIVQALDIGSRASNSELR